MSFEGGPKPEFTEAEQALIARLKEKTVEDPETREALLAWCKEQEEAATSEGNAESGDGARASIELDLKKAKLYRASGCAEEAWASLNAAREMANNIGDGDLFNEAERIMDEMDGAAGGEG